MTKKKFTFKVTKPDYSNPDYSKSVAQEKIEDFVAVEKTAEEIYSSVPTYSNKDRVLIIDFDIMAFKIASVCEFKYNFSDDNGVSVDVKSKTAFKQYCDEEGIEYDSFICKNVQVPEPVSFALKTVKDSLNNVLEFTGCNKYEVYVGGSGNFRLNIPAPVEYKSSRKDMVRPIHLTAVKNYGLKYLNGVKVKDVEADDVVAHRMRTLYKQGIRATLYSCDKDALGNVDHKLQMYDPIKEDIIISEGGVGSIELVKSKLKGKGLKFLIYQLCQGDPVDSYTPKQFFKKRYGDSSFFKDFNVCKTEVEVLERFIEVAKRLVPDKVSYTSFNGQLMNLNRKELFEMYYTLCKMRDGWCETLEDLFSFYNLDIDEMDIEEGSENE